MTRASGVIKTNTEKKIENTSFDVGLDFAHDNNLYVAQKNINQYFEDIFHKLPKNTRRAYQADINLYRAFCVGNGFVIFSNSIEQTEDSIKAYFLHMCEKEFAYSTIKRRLSAISAFLEVATLPNPLLESKHLRDFVKVSLDDAEIDNNPQQADAMTVDVLNEINQKFVPKDLQDLRDIAIINTAYDGLLRADEVRRLRVSDINRSKNTVFIRKSKTDRAGKGQRRFISDETIAMIDAYVAAANYDKKNKVTRDKSDRKAIYKGPLFRPIHSKLTTLRVPANKKGEEQPIEPIDYKTVLRAYQRIGEEVNVGVSLTGHSARVGAAVTMAENDVSGFYIQKAGGWKSSVMPARYTEETEAAKGGMAQINNLKK